MFMVQKWLKYIVQNTKNREVMEKYHEIKEFPYLSKEENEKRQLDKLNRLLNHACKNVPFYKKVLQECSIVENGKIELHNLAEIEKIPLLSKDTIRHEKQKMHANDIAQRESYKNTSGGSTGEPLVFMRDQSMHINSMANYYIAQSWRGADPYDSVIWFWGAIRDTYDGQKAFKEYVKDFLGNKMELNSFKMSEEDMRYFIKILNKHKPKLLATYTESIYEIVKFAKKNNIHLEKQNAIHATSSTVYDFMREEIEEAFQCKIFSHYGSREVGSMASECSAHDGLHLMMEHTLVEVINSDGHACLPGEEGEIVVTTLNNFSMPLIRYKIGDIGIMQEYGSCICGCSYPKLQKVVGRTTSVFKTKSGDRVAGEYFTLLFNFYDWVKNFQVIQKDLDYILVKIVNIKEIDHASLDVVVEKIKRIMGDECKVEFEFLDEIPKTQTGKYLFTISEVKD